MREIFCSCGIVAVVWVLKWVDQCKGICVEFICVSREHGVDMNMDPYKEWIENKHINKFC